MKRLAHLRITFGKNLSPLGGVSAYNCTVSGDMFFTSASNRRTVNASGCCSNGMWGVEYINCSADAFNSSNSWNVSYTFNNRSRQSMVNNGTKLPSKGKIFVENGGLYKYIDETKCCFLGIVDSSLFDGIIKQNTISLSSKSLDRATCSFVKIPASVIYVGNPVSSTNIKVLYEGTSIPSTWNNGWFNGVSLYVNATSIASNSDFEYIVGTTITIIKYLGTNSNVVIPSEIDGKRVVAIGDSAFRCLPITSVEIPEGVIEISRYAFYECRELTSVKLPSTLVRIGMYSFSRCSKITSITIPASVIEIGDYAYYECSSLVSLTIEDGSVLEFIGSYAFNVNSLKGHLVIPSSVKYIGDSAFYSTQMTFEITSDSQLTYIGNSAFAYNWNGQSTIYLSSKVEYVGSNAFNTYNFSIYCEAESRPSSWDVNWLEGTSDKPTVTWGVTRYESRQTVEGIKYRIVNDTVFIIGYVGESKDIVIPNEIDGLTVKEISKNAFTESDIVSVVLPNTLIRIGDYAFYSCHSLTSITIPASVVEIGDCAFYGCSSLASLTIEEGSVLEYIGSFSFRAYSLKSHLIIPSSVKYIGNNAFDTTQMSFEVGINSQLTYIGDFAFGNQWNSPSTIYLSSKVEFVGSCAFTSPYFTIYCEPESRPSSWNSNWLGDSGNKPKVTWGVKSFSSGTTEDGFTYSIVNGKATILSYKLDNYSIVVIPEEIEGCPVTSIKTSLSGGTYIYVPDSVEYIGSMAFCGNVLYEGSQIPSTWESDWHYGYRGLDNASYNVYFNVKEIVTSSDGLYSIAVFDDNTAMLLEYNGEDTEVSIPSSIDGYIVTKIGEAFRENSDLTSIVLPNTIESIESLAFYNCYSLTSITTEEGIRYIGDCAFYGCHSLASITIPASVVEIGDYAFYGCSSLTSLTIEEGSDLEYVGSYAFNVYSLKGHLVIPNTVKYIGDYAFNNTQMTFEINSDSQLTHIGEWAFADNWNGQSTIYLSSKVEHVGSNAFNKNNFSIYCEVESRPSSWDVKWLGENSDKLKVTWGVTRYESGQTAEGIKYRIINDTVFIIGYVGESKDIVIPNEIEGLTVKEISRYAFSISEIVSVVLPDTLIRIGDYAFYDCDSLGSITIPASVVEIGDCAFNNCSSLTSLTIKEGSDLEYVGSYAFNVYSLKGHLVIPNTVKYIGDYAFNNTQMTFEINSDSQLTHIGEWAFADNWNGQSTIYLSSKVEHVGSNAFNKNNFSIYCEVESRPSSWDVKWLGENSDKLKVTWGVTRYESGQTAEGIKYRIINDTVFIIGYVGESKDIVIPNEIEGLTVKEISRYAFSISEIVSVVLPDTLIRIGDYAFYDCDSLGSITIPASVVEIGDCAFNNCSSLTSLIIEEGSVLEYIGNGALRSDNLSGHLIIPNTVKYIGDSAFNNTQMSFEIGINSQLTYIGNWAFAYNWYGQSTIYLSSKVEYVGYYAFSSTNYFTIYCEVESRPSSWDVSWLGENSNKPIVTWGVQF